MSLTGQIQRRQLIMVDNNRFIVSHAPFRHDGSTALYHFPSPRQLSGNLYFVVQQKVQ